MTHFARNPAGLKALPFFAAFSEPELMALAASIQRRTYTSRRSLIRAGDKADGLYVMLAGRAHVLLSDDHGRQIIVAVLGPNDIVGELDVFDVAAPAVQVEAQEQCEALFIPKASVLRLLAHNPGAALIMVRLLGHRLADAQRTIGQLGLLNVYGRVATVLLDHSREVGGDWLVEASSQRIAAMVGASREMVARVVKDMIGRGLVRRSQRKLIVLDRAALTAPRAAQNNASRSAGVAYLSGYVTTDSADAASRALSRAERAPA